MLWAISSLFSEKHKFKGIKRIGLELQTGAMGTICSTRCATTSGLIPNNKCLRRDDQLLFVKIRRCAFLT